jgi:hypothetical protein
VGHDRKAGHGGEEICRFCGGDENGIAGKGHRSGPVGPEAELVGDGEWIFAVVYLVDESAVNKAAEDASNRVEDDGRCGGEEIDELRMGKSTIPDGTDGVKSCCDRGETDSVVTEGRGGVKDVVKEAES